MAQVFKLVGSPLVCHAFNGDASQLAISADSNNVIIFSIPKAPTPNHRYEQLAILKAHTGTVTGLDWAHKSDRIVSCSADRNAYVWIKQADGKWHPKLVVLQINRAAFSVLWSPNENKFAVGSSDRSLSICYFDNDNDWWTPKAIKKNIRSTVTCLDWHPNNSLVACGSSDFKIRVYSASIKQAGDEKPEETPWGSKVTFGHLLFEAATGGGGWIHGVSFSSDGCRLAWVAHDCTISVAEVQACGVAPVVQTVKHKCLPFISLSWVGRNSLICVGHDNSPMLFEYTGSGINFIAAIDEGITAGETKVNSKRAAFESFQAIDRLRMNPADQEAKLTSLHQNAINELKIVRGDKSKATLISTIGRDGNLVLWDLPTLSQRVAKLRIN
jgi:actin related protein 2/3 complex, subunit 1A/1B